MDANWQPTQGSDPAAAAAAVGDWRAQLQPEARSRVVNTILETLKKNLPLAAPDGPTQLQKIARRFEEKIYTEATNQSDYVRKISLKMVSTETNGQQAPGNAQVIPNQNNSENQQYMPLHQPHQLGSQANMASLQHQQLLGTVPNVSNIQRMHMLQTEAQQPQEQQHAQQPPMDLMQPQSQHNQLQLSQQHLMSQFQSQPDQLQQQSGMQPQSSMQQRLQTSGDMLLQQNNMDPIQAQRGLQEASSSTSVDSTAETGHAGADYWQEEIYQMVKILKDQYFAELSELFNKMCLKLQHVDSITPLPIPSELHDRMKSFKMLLERILQMLQISKSGIQPAMRDKVPQYEKQIITILNFLRKPVQPQVQQ